MAGKEEAREEIKKLVGKFSKYLKSELDSMPEEDIKFQFIEPMFEALGWEREDISKEKRVLKGRADYILRIGNQESLVIEAKKTDVSLNEDAGRQAVSYAYHRKIKFSVLTNFKYVRVYHALSNIKNIDRNLLFWIEFTDFEKEFEKLWLLSKESMQKNELSKYVSSKEERKFKPVNDSILEDLLEIRKLLSSDLKKLRIYLGEEKIDEAIQILINRLIFMRSVEDRGLENMNFLLGFVKDFREGRERRRLWDVLQKEFHKIRRGVKETQTYQDGFKIYHNFVRKNVKDKTTPADKCKIGIVNQNKWEGLLLKSLEKVPQLTGDDNLAISP